MLTVFFRQQQELSPHPTVTSISSRNPGQNSQSSKGKGICNIRQYHTFVWRCLEESSEEAALNEITSLLEEDKNLALAKMAIKENKKRRVKKMTDIYITAKVTLNQKFTIHTHQLTDVAKRVELSVDQTTRLLNEMRELQELNSSIENDIVIFHVCDEKSEESLFREMKALEQSTLCLKESIAQLDRIRVQNFQFESQKLIL